jgi:hypothetical protein
VHVSEFKERNGISRTASRPHRAEWQKKSAEPRFHGRKAKQQVDAATHRPLPIRPGLDWKIRPKDRSRRLISYDIALDRANAVYLK